MLAHTAPFISGLRRFVAAAMVAAALVLPATGCGSSSSKSPAKQQQVNRALGSHPDAYKLTCSDVSNHDKVLSVTNAAFDLANRLDLRTDSILHVATRIYAAQHDLCAKRADKTYRPTKDAVAAVKGGRYKVKTAAP